jgi:hypothetical protein
MSKIGYLILVLSIVVTWYALPAPPAPRQVVITNCWQVGQDTYCHWRYAS